MTQLNAPRPREVIILTALPVECRDSTDEGLRPSGEGKACAIFGRAPGTFCSFSAFLPSPRRTLYPCRKLNPGEP
jgi:hypothetical protein